MANDSSPDQIKQIDATALLRSLPANSVPFIFTDPPYGIGYHSNYYKERNPHAPVMNDWNFQIGAFLRECARVMADGAALYLCCRWDITPLWMPYVVPSGLKTKTVIVWVKDNWSAGDLTGTFGNQYEQVLFITKGRHRLRGHRWPNVWQFPRVSHTRLLHPAQKPTALVERAILASSDPGDLVLDPFCGSGTTGEAARQAGRRFLLCDVDPQMVVVSRKRLGFQVEDVPEQEHEVVLAPSDLTLEFADPADWGVHPEDLRAIRDLMLGNVASLSQPTLFPLPSPQPSKGSTRTRKRRAA